eukprot:8984870-Pyramimonas_sp.AAC.1
MLPTATPPPSRAKWHAPPMVIESVYYAPPFVYVWKFGVKALGRLPLIVQCTQNTFANYPSPNVKPRTPWLEY